MCTFLSLSMGVRGFLPVASFSGSNLQLEAAAYASRPVDDAPKLGLMLGRYQRHRSVLAQPQQWASTTTTTLFSGSSGHDDHVDEEEEEDWRDFRAKLVMQFQNEQVKSSTDSPVDGYDNHTSPTTTITTTTTAPASSVSATGWAYESDNTIETGSVILSRVKQDFGHGIRQQYFHKCVILVLEHQEGVFTKGIILNRPTGLVLSRSDFINCDDKSHPSTETTDASVTTSSGENVVDVEMDSSTGTDSDSDDDKWKIWFGGDVLSMESPRTEWTCLHSLTHVPEAIEVSGKVMKKIHWTTLESAQDLVHRGLAKPSDFWLFTGYCGWGPGQLAHELKRESWYMAATDPQTLLLELQKQDLGNSDPRDAGLETWGLLTQRIGRGGQVKTQSPSGYTEDFEDLMLREWAREHLIVPTDRDEAGASENLNVPTEIKTEERVLLGSFPPQMISVPVASPSTPLQPTPTLATGSLLFTSEQSSLSEGGGRPPFLLNHQEFHKGILLIIQHDDDATVGVLLNLPSRKGMDIRGMDGSPGSTIPLRYGGSYSAKGQSNKSLLWYHCNPRLRQANVGIQLGSSSVYGCSFDEVKQALEAGLAAPTDFMAVSGFRVWPSAKNVASLSAAGPTMLDEIDSGKFQVVDDQENVVEDIWETLSQQAPITTENARVNLKVASHAWYTALAASLPGKDAEDEPSSLPSGKPELLSLSQLVYKSETNVHTLAEKAWKRWVASFLLGDPSLPI